MATSITYDFGGITGGALSLRGETVSPVSVGQRIAVSITAVNVTSIFVDAASFGHKCLDVAGVVTDAQNGVVMAFVPVQVCIGQTPPYLPRGGYEAVALQTSTAVPSSLAGQTLNVYVGPQGAFTGAIVGALFTPGTDVLNKTVTVAGTPAPAGSPGTFGSTPTAPAAPGTTKSNTLLYVGLGLGVVLFGAGWYDLALHKAGASRETVVVQEAPR